jgi:hypothetical protein
MPLREPASDRDLFGVLFFILVSFGYQSRSLVGFRGHKNAVLSVERTADRLFAWQASFGNSTAISRSRDLGW